MARNPMPRGQSLRYAFSELLELLEDSSSDILGQRRGLEGSFSHVWLTEM